jgi:hypothetical protein
MLLSLALSYLQGSDSHVYVPIMFLHCGNSNACSDIVATVPLRPHRTQTGAGQGGLMDSTNTHGL